MIVRNTLPSSTVGRDSLAELKVSLRWSSPEATHVEHHHAHRVNMWRDLFPPRVAENLYGKSPGDRMSFSYGRDELVPFPDDRLIQHLPAHHFRGSIHDGRVVQPRLGRFYPRSLLDDARGVLPQDSAPMRIVGLNDAGIVANLNHPLSGKRLQLDVKLTGLEQTRGERGGRLSAWGEELAGNGPGMQCRWNGQPTDFSDDGPLQRDNEDNDSLFYRSARMVGHVDETASGFVRREYLERLSPGSRVLDLMSGFHSHLPENHEFTVTGLGMNREEMSANPALSDCIVHDLNDNPLLPFDDESFDGVLCSLSIEYLVRPSRVVEAIVRVLRPGGVFMASFSNRWFPPKVTRLWTELHDFERMGLVLDLLIQARSFENLFTVSYRNWPRPESDRHYPALPKSDPVFLVGGIRRKTAILEETSHL